MLGGSCRIVRDTPITAAARVTTDHALCRTIDNAEIAARARLTRGDASFRIVHETAMPPLP